MTSRRGLSLKRKHGPHFPLCVRHVLSTFPFTKLWTHQCFFLFFCSGKRNLLFRSKLNPWTWTTDVRARRNQRCSVKRRYNKPVHYCRRILARAASALHSSHWSSLISKLFSYLFTELKVGKLGVYNIQVGTVPTSTPPLFLHTQMLRNVFQIRGSVNLLPSVCQTTTPFPHYNSFVLFYSISIAITSAFTNAFSCAFTIAFSRAFTNAFSTWIGCITCTPSWCTRHQPQKF